MDDQINAAERTVRLSGRWSAGDDPSRRRDPAAQVAAPVSRRPPTPWPRPVQVVEEPVTHPGDGAVADPLTAPDPDALPTIAVPRRSSGDVAGARARNRENWRRAHDLLQRMWQEATPDAPRPGQAWSQFLLERAEAEKAIGELKDELFRWHLERERALDEEEKDADEQGR